jgi:hypothetical protein
MAEVQFAYRFFVGHNDAVDMMELEKEAALYNDVEILNFVDNYQTLPEKACPLDGRNVSQYDTSAQ